MAEAKDIPRERIYEWIDGVEEPHGYCIGGYHPVSIDDELSNGRYHIVHKLGFGSYSTVWLAKDRDTSEYVAIKILCAKSSASIHDDYVRKLMTHIQTDYSEIIGAKYVAKQIDEFYVEGKNGRHACLVSRPASFTIQAAQEYSDEGLFAPQLASAIAAKTILGVHFLHDCGVVHGDLHIGNILLKTSDLNDLTIDELYQRFQKPAELPIKRIDGAPLDAGVPSHLVVPLWSAIDCEKIINAEVTITDFSEAYVKSQVQREQLNTPLLLCPPEMLLRMGKLIGKPADIWTLGCTLVNIVGIKSLFEGFAPDSDDVMAEIVSALGKPPDRWWNLWEKRHEFFKEDGSWSVSPERCHDSVSRSLEWRVKSRMKRGNEEPEPAELKALLEMLHGMLAWEPAYRWRIVDVVKSEWMEKYGKPAVETLKDVPIGPAPEPLPPIITDDEYALPDEDYEADAEDIAATRAKMSQLFVDSDKKPALSRDNKEIRTDTTEDGMTIPICLSNKGKAVDHDTGGRAECYPADG